MTSIHGSHESLRYAGVGSDSLSPDQIAGRLGRLTEIAKHRYEIDVLSEFTYQQVTEVFLRVNSGGKALNTSDLLLSTLSARWPGALAKLACKADELARAHFAALDTGFLVRAPAGAVLKQGLSHSSYGAITAATDEQLTTGWGVVVRGVDDLLPLLKETSRSAAAPYSGLPTL